MSNLDLLFQKPTAAAPGAARPSSVGTPARKAGASTTNRGGRAFDDVMSRVTDDASSRDSAATGGVRANGGAREQAPAARAKKTNEPSASEPSAVNGSNTSAAQAAPAQSQTVAGEGRAQGSATESKKDTAAKKDAQDAVDGESRGNLSGESSAVSAAQIPNTQAAAQATAGATAWLLASVSMSAQGRVPLDTLTQGGDASAVGATATAGALNGAATEASTALASDAAAQAASDAAATAASINQTTAAHTNSSNLAAADLAALASESQDPISASQAALAEAAAKAAAAAERKATAQSTATSATDAEALAPTVQGHVSANAANATGESIDAEAQSNGIVNLPGSASGAGAKATLNARQNGGTAIPLDAARQRAATELQSALARAAAGQHATQAPGALDSTPSNSGLASGANASVAGNGAHGVNAANGAAATASASALLATNLAANAAAGGDARAERQAANGAGDATNLVTAAAQAAAEEASAQAGGEGRASEGDGFARSAGGNGSATAGANGSTIAGGAGGAQAFQLGAPASSESSATISSSSANAIDPRASGGAAPADRVGGTFAGLTGGERLGGGSQVSEADSQQIIRNMRLQWRGPVGEAQLVLRPEHLGQVTVTVRVDRGAVSATLRAETAAAQQWMQAHQQDLRQALQQQGLEVAEVVITTNPDGQRQQQHAQDQGGASRQRQPRTGADANQPRFEIRV